MKNIKIKGVIYPEVEELEVPKAEGGTTIFVEQSSIPTVQAVKETSVNEIGPQTITPDDNYEAMETVIVNVDIEGEEVERTITANGPYTINVPGSLMADVILEVNVPTGGEENVQGTKLFSVTQNYSSLPIEPDDGYTAMRKVQLNVDVHNTPSISVSAAGLITVSGEGINTVTHQLSEEDDADFAKANIKKGVTIFGKVGTYEGGGSPDPTWTTFISNNTSEKTITQVFQTLNFNASGKNGWLQVVMNQPTAPTAGYSSGKTYGAFVMGIVNGEVKGGLTYYKTGLTTIDTTNWKFGDTFSSGGGGVVNTAVYRTNSSGVIVAEGVGTSDRLGIGGSARWCFQECKMA